MRKIRNKLIGISAVAQWVQNPTAATWVATEAGFPPWPGAGGKGSGVAPNAA